MSDKNRPLGEYSANLESDEIPKGGSVIPVTPSVFFGGRRSEPGTFPSRGEEGKPSPFPSERETVRGNYKNQVGLELKPKSNKILRELPSIALNLGAMEQKTESLLKRKEFLELDEHSRVEKEKDLQAQINRISNFCADATSETGVPSESIEDVNTWIEELLTDLGILESELDQIKKEEDDSVAKKQQDLESDQTLLLERLPLIARYGELSFRLNLLLSSNLDIAKKTKLYDADRSLSWLSNPSDHPEVTTGDINSNLNTFSDLLDEAEEEIILLKKRSSLVESYEKEGRLLASFFDTIIDVDEKNDLASLAADVDTKRKAAEDSLTRDTFDAFKGTLNDFILLIEASLQKLTIPFPAAPLPASPATTPIVAAAVAPTGPALPQSQEARRSRNIWGGIQKNVFEEIKTKTSKYFQIVKENGDIVPSQEPYTKWVAVRDNFNKEFADYEEFLKNPRTDTVRKIAECEELINAKNAVIDALFEDNLSLAAKLIDDFREAIEIERRAWAEKSALENQERRKKETFEAEQNALHKAFEEDNKKYDDLLARKDFLLEELANSPGEFAMLDRLFHKLTEERAVLAEKFNNHEVLSTAELEHYADNFIIDTAREPNARPVVTDSLATIVDKINEKLDTLHQKGVLRSTAFSDPRYRIPAIKNNNTVELSPETLESLTKKHHELFEDDREDYLKTYLHKKWSPNDPAQAVVEKILSEYKNGLELTKEAIQTTINSHALALSTETDPLIRHAHRKDLTSLEAEMREVLAQLERISVIGEKTLQKQKENQEGLTKTLRGIRQTYSPTRDSRMVDVGWKREEYVDEESKKAFDAARNARLKDDKDLDDAGLAAKLAAEIDIEQHMSPEELLATKEREGDSISNQQGMVSPNYLENNPTPTQAKTHEQLEEEKALETEGRKRKSIAVNKIIDSLLKIRLSKFPKATPLWQTLGVVTLTAAAAVSTHLITRSSSEQVKSPQTAGEAVSLENLFSPEEQVMLEDLAGEKKLSFIAFMKKYAKDVNIDPNNPSTISSLSKMECEKLLNSPDVVYGLNNEQRQQICKIVRNLEKDVQVYDKNRPHTAYYIPSPYKYVDHTMNLENFYAVVVKIVTESRAARNAK